MKNKLIGWKLYAYIYKLTAGRYRTMDKWLRNRYVYDLREFFLLKDTKE